MSGPGNRLGRSLRRVAGSLLRRAGYRLVKLPPVDQRYRGASHSLATDLPSGAAEHLRNDAPRLQALRKRYADCDLPMAAATMWGDGYLDRELSLAHFRGDNAYVWQFRNLGGSAALKYYLYLRDIAARDRHGLLTKLGEDELFGCWTFDYPGWPRVSRELLDSINELDFLDRHLDLFQRKDLSIIDIGAGYGRLAHRALAATPGIRRYWCTDAIPESTFLCEYYLGFRDVGERARVVPLDELDATLPGQPLDLAINVHSFSEMSRSAIDGWLQRLADWNVPWLFVVPNDAEQLLTVEADGRRGEFSSLLEKHGYRLHVKEPVFQDPTLRGYMSVRDHFFLFRRCTDTPT